MKLTVPACWIALLAVSCLSASGANDVPVNGRYALENGYFHLAGSGGAIDTFRVDPAGRGEFSANWIRQLRLGDQAMPPLPDTTCEVGPGVLRLRNVPVARIETRDIGKRQAAFPLWPGKRIGQRFRVESTQFVAVSGFFPTYCSRTSGFTLTLRRDNAEGDIVARKDYRNVPDASEQKLPFDPQPAGIYYLEMSNAVGTPGWWYCDEPPTADQAGFVTGLAGDETVPHAFWIRIYGMSEHKADWTLTLDGNRLSWTIEGEKGIRAQIETPWIRDGYKTQDPEHIVFTRFVGDNGLYRPVHQFKRRERESIDISGWIEMTSPLGFNLRFLFPGGGHVDWRMDSDRMTFPFDRRTMTIEALPHNDGPPDRFPVFFSSDPKMDKELNAFLYSHAFNFGAGCFPDWKEWQGRILCWTQNPQKELQAHHLRKGYKIRPDGYVHTWGDDEGWPFPFKDDDKNGVNDFDTRHFTTNACFILGCAHHALWTRDRDFLADALPRARAAMEYQLKDLQGEKGILVITAPGHEGRHGGIGSNYWDILPFGYKDAFTNSYYYASLEAMARLEELAALMDLPTGARSPEFYRSLRDVLRRDYTATFWDDEAGRFIGCVDVDGVRHDYGFSWINTEAIAYGLATPEQVERIYRWMEKGKTATGKADTYSRWVFAPRASTFFNPPHHAMNWRQTLTPTDLPPWWHSGWHMSDYEDQCQAGGAILYTSYYDIVSRAQYRSADNAWKRFRTILNRYSMPDHLSGGSPLCRGETSQGHGIPGSVGVESEFPESGLVPVSFLYAFLGIEPDAQGLKIRPNLPRALDFAGVRNLSYGGKTYEIRVNHTSIAARCTDPGSTFAIEMPVEPDETFCLDTHLSAAK